MRLVLLPGMDGTGRLFASFIHALKQTIPCSVISYPPDLCLGYAELTHYVRDRLPEDEPYVLLAESFSGPIAYDLAHLAAPGLHGIIFVASFLRRPNHLLGLLPMLPLSVLLSIRPADVIIRHWMLSRESDQTQLQLFKDVLQSVSNKVLAHRLQQIRHLGFEPKLISVSVSYIQPLNDKLVGRENVRDFYTIQPDLKLIELNGPHFILQDRPQECARIVEQLLQ